MAWFKSNIDNAVFQFTDPRDISWCQSNHNWTEVADAQGTPLNAGSGIGTWILTTGVVSPQQLNASVAAPKTADDAEQKLRQNVLPPFRGEEKCSPPKPPQGYPREPYFHDNPERNAQSERVVRRFLTTNMREWATCRFTREPLELRFEGAAMKDDPYGGEFVKPVFFCPHCGVYGS